MVRRLQGKERFNLNYNEMTSYDVCDFYNLSITNLYLLKKIGLPYNVVHRTTHTYNYESVEEFLNVDGDIYSKDRVLIKVGEVVKRLSISKNKVYRLMENHGFPYYELKGNKGNNVYRFDEEEIDFWLEDNLNKIKG